MTIEQIDQALAVWRTKLTLAADNLLALDDLTTYKRLEGKDGLPQAQLTGVTQARVTPALAAMHELFQHIGLLNDVIARATELRKSIFPFRRSEATVNEIERLLLGSSINLPSVQTPLAQRGLLSASEQTTTITPERLLAAMTQAFDAARNAVFAVDAAWTRLEPALGAAESNAQALQQLSDSLGEGDCVELIAARRKIAEQRSRVQTDPLGVDEGLTRDVVPLLQQAEVRLREQAQRRDGVLADLIRARSLLQEMEALHRRCEQAWAECREKIDGAAGAAALDSNWIAELDRWLGTLETTQQQGRWKPTRIGLDRWLQTADDYLARERASCAAARALLDTRAELRGRLSALKAKAQARGLGVDGALSALAQEAEQLLYARTTPLEAAAARVSTYEAQLSARLKQQNKP